MAPTNVSTMALKRIWWPRNSSGISVSEAPAAFPMPSARWPVFLPMATLLVFEIQLDQIAETRAHGAIRLVSDAEHVHARVHFAFHLLELDGLRRNLNGDGNARRIRPGVEERGAHRRRDGAGRGGGRAALQRLFDGVAGQRIARSHVAVARPRTHACAALIHFDFQGVATAFGRLGRRVTDNVVLILFLADLLHAADQVVRVGDHEASGAFRQQVHDLLIVGGAGWKGGNVQARRIVVGVVPVVGIVEIIGSAAVVIVVGGGVAGAGAGVAGSGTARATGRPGVARGGAARGGARRTAAAGGSARVAASTAAGSAARPAAVLAATR